MSKRTINDLYCQFLIAAQKNYTCTELADRLQDKPYHDTFNRWLHTDRLTPKLLWKGCKETIDKTHGDLIFDDTVFDKWYGQSISLVYQQYSSVHKRVVNGIGLVTLLWYSHYQHLPTDYRLFDPKTDGKTRNDHAREMLTIAFKRGFSPGYVILDSWYASADTLKLINSYGWKFIAWVKGNRKVSFIAHEQYTLEELPLSDKGAILLLRGFGKVKVLKLVHQDQHIEYLVTNDLSLSPSDILSVAARRWEIELYHRGLKQVAGSPYCQARINRSQRNHIFCSIRVFLAFEQETFRTGYSWYELKDKVISEAISFYLRSPTISLPPLR